MDFEYTRKSSRAIDDVVADIERLTAEHKFRILHVHDVQATLAEKGFRREPLKIIELCNAAFAHEALKNDVRASLFMPCKINVYTEGGKTMVKALRPTAIAEFLPEAHLADLAGEVDGVITAIVDGSVAGV